MGHQGQTKSYRARMKKDFWPRNDNESDYNK